jgi:hypothetical protein
MKKPKKKHSLLKHVFLLCGISCILIAAGCYPAYLLARHFVNRYLDDWGTRLVDLERRGLLSREFGAGWQDVLADQSMDTQARRLTRPEDSGSLVAAVNGIQLADYPSLSIIDRLREVRAYSNSIEIVDRCNRPLALIRTDHQRAAIGEFSPVLVNAIIAAEDRTFLTNNGFAFSSFVRAILRSGLESCRTLRLSPPRGTSTITQQVAKLFISRLDESGRRHVGRSLDRKLRELRLAAALRKQYSADDIMEIYLNHCVTSDYGMVGYKDIARGLFNCEPQKLSDAQCVYLSRMVKWGRNARKKIVAQCHIDMPRIGKQLNWSAAKQKQVLAQIDTLTFARPRRVETAYGPLVDLANEFWLLALRSSGFTPEQLEPMDIIDPASLIRKKGNLRITLSIDAPLQRTLETLVSTRGYGPDTAIVTEIAVAAHDTTVTSPSRPRDTVHSLKILREPLDFREKSAAEITTINPGDSVFVTIRYTKAGPERYRRKSTTFYRKSIVRSGQYFAYAIMDSRTGKLLAYYSKDRLGSRLACLLRNRTPNGSSTAKPILNALMFDLGIFRPTTRWTDEENVTADVPWKRILDYRKGKPVGVIFANSAVRGQGYQVHNHGSIFEGCRHVFDHLSTSNNILGVETVYRLNQEIFTRGREIIQDAMPLVQYYYRIGALARVKDSLRLTSVTGVRAYKELARIVGVPVDSSVPSDQNYSVALGTLELSLYEQLHLFNALYQNDLIDRPAEHPSLVIESIVLNNDTVTVADTVRRYHPFADIGNLRPSWLGMHLRLTSNPADGLSAYDIASPDSAGPTGLTDSIFSPDLFTFGGPPANFAKSGTTDDCIMPFDAPPGSSRRTNYGNWNAVIRLDMNVLAAGGDSIADVKDVTVACIGECSPKHTGEPDGKTLHKFVTSGLLKKAGIRSPGGFFSRYEKYLRATTPESENCGTGSVSPASDLPAIDKRGD